MWAYLVQLADLLLTPDVGFVISKHLKPAGGRDRKAAQKCYAQLSHLDSPGLPVVVQQHVDQVSEELGLPGAEEAGLDLVHGKFQLRQMLVVLPGVVAAGNRK